MKTTFIIIFIQISFFSFTQNDLDTVFIKYNNSETNEVIYDTDTILFESTMLRNMISGTSIWPSSSNQYNAYWIHGIHLDKVESSSCKGQVNQNESIKTGITEILSNDSTWTFKIMISENCCYSFLCDIKVVNKKILELEYYGYGTNHCDCDCFFELTYTLSKEQLDISTDIEYVRIFENNKTKKKIN